MPKLLVNLVEGVTVFLQLEYVYFWGVIQWGIAKEHVENLPKDAPSMRRREKDNAAKAIHNGFICWVVQAKYKRFLDYKAAHRVDNEHDGDLEYISFGDTIR
jgi:hypothetical protein